MLEFGTCVFQLYEQNVQVKHTIPKKDKFDLDLAFTVRHGLIARSGLHSRS